MKTPSETADPSGETLGVVDRLRETGAMGGVTIALLLWSVGFQAVTSDHFQYLLPARQAADPDFVRGDWFASSTTPYHFVFRAVTSLAERSGLLIETLIVMQILIAIAIVVGFKQLSRGVNTTWLAVPIALFVVRFGIETTWGSVQFFRISPLPHAIGMALTLVTVGVMSQGRYRLACALAVAVSYAHVSAGAWAIVVIAAMAADDLLRGKCHWKTLLLPVAASALALLPILAFIGSRFAGAPVPPETYEILFYTRASHHFSFVDFRLEDHVRLIVVALVALGCEHVLRLDRRSIRAAILTIIGLGLMAAFFLHVVYWPLPVRLVPYRLTPVLTAIAAMLASAVLLDQRQRWLVRLAGVTALVLSQSPLVLAKSLAFAFSATLLTAAAVIAVGLFLVYFLIERRRGGDPLAVPTTLPSIFTGLFLLMLVANATVGSDLPVVDLGALSVGTSVGLGAFAAVGAIRKKSLPATTCAVLALLLVIVPVTTAAMLYRPPKHTTEWLNQSQQAIVDIVTDVVPPGGLLVISPDESFVRFSTGRAVVVDFKAFPYEGEFMSEWLERLEAVTGRSISTDGARGFALQRELAADYAARPLADLTATAESFGAGFVLVSASSTAAEEALLDDSITSWSSDSFVLIAVG